MGAELTPDLPTFLAQLPEAHKLPATPVATHAAYKKDKYNSHNVYSYGGNHCSAKNNLCTMGANHIGVSETRHGSKGCTSSCNGRKMNWEYKSTVPSGYAPTPRGCIALELSAQ
jgi:hypothetical protein